MKFALRRNLIYPFQLIIWNTLRKLEMILINHLFDFDNSLIYTTLMFLGEFFSGFLIYLYQQKSLCKKKNKEVKFMSVSLIESNNDMLIPDGKWKINFLIFVISFVDWVEFIIWTVCIPKYIGISDSIVFRLNCIITIAGALFYRYVLKLTIFKHQLFSLIVISICLIIIIITEYLFQEFNFFLTVKDFSISLFLNALYQIFCALIDNIEKYLFEYNYFNPFFVLRYEGMFGFFISFLNFDFPDYGKDFIKVYKNNSIENNFLFTFLILLYIVLCGGRNVFRVVTTKLYSPMARGLTEYFINPIYLIIGFINNDDFIVRGEKNVLYFVVNLILSIIISFCGCVFNEFIILYFCNLEHETHHQISKRAINDELCKIEYGLDDISSENDEDKKELSMVCL